MLQRKSRKKMAEINVVPYIDVMLVLLVIFMVTIPVIHQSVKVELPKADSKLTESISSSPIILTVESKGRMYLNVHRDSTLPLQPEEVVNQVAAHLQIAREKNEEKAVMIRGDRELDYESLMGAILLLKRAGAPRVGLITDPENTSKSL